MKDRPVPRLKRFAPFATFTPTGFAQVCDWKRINVFERACLVDQNRLAKKGQGEPDSFALTWLGRHCIVLYCIVLYCIVLYRIVLRRAASV